MLKSTLEACNQCSNAAVAFGFHDKSAASKSQISRVFLIHVTGNLQAVSSDTGNLLDDFTLVKPANYTPNYTGRAHLAVRFTISFPPVSTAENFHNTVQSAGVLTSSGASSGSGNLAQPELAHLPMLLHCLKGKREERSSCSHLDACTRLGNGSQS